MSSTPEPIGRRRFDGPPRIALEPPGPRSWLTDAIEAGGAAIVPLPDAEAIVWATPTGPDELAATVASAPGVHWVQLPWAGVEPFVSVLDHDHLWTCGKGVYAEPVAEHILTLALAGMRGLGTYVARHELGNAPGKEPARRERRHPRRRRDRHVAAAAARTVRRARHGAASPRPSRWRAPTASARSTTSTRSLPAADLVVLALALTPETVGRASTRRRLALDAADGMDREPRTRPPHRHRRPRRRAARRHRSAAPRWTSPIPSRCPPGHPLWTMPNAIVTPHIGNTPDMALPLLKRHGSPRTCGASPDGEPLIGAVDVDAGY